MEKNLTLTVKPENVEIIQENDMVTIKISNDMKMTIQMTGDMMIQTGGDFHILSKGEMSFASENGVHIDSVGSNIHLNSRQSKILKNTEEAIQYKVKHELENNKHLLDGNKKCQE